MVGSAAREGSARLVLLAVACSVLWSAQPALAHTSLTGSTPATDSLVVAPIEVVTLVFSQPVSPQQVQVVVTGPSGADVAAGPAQVSGATVTQAVGAWPVSGDHRLAYRVLAQDGHPITGEVPFQVALPAPSSAPPTAAPTIPAATTDGSAGAPQAAARPAGTGVALPLLAALGVGAVVLVVGAVRAGRRPQVGR